MDYSVLGFFAFFLQAVVLMGGKASDINSFDTNYYITWGNDHVLSQNQGREIQLSMDISSGAGFGSKLSYGSGFFHLRIKLPDKDSAGVVTPFYSMKSSLNFYACHTYSCSFLHWEVSNLRFYVDNIPIRVFKNNTNIGVSYPSQPMQIEASLWDGDSWATDGGQTKTNWSHAPFKAHFQESHMADLKVNKRLLDELEAMGFPLARSTRALHYSGNSSIEDAINWIIDHENDSDIDQMPLSTQVVVNIDIQSPETSNISGQVMLKAQQLRERAGRKKEEEEKELERAREKERIRAGKELLKTKTIGEDNERKRFLALQKAEKEEEKRARDKIRQKLQQDKVFLWTLSTSHIFL
ncbi:hypothetical protein F0562_002299 [Nyssa sinensis]|uniref:UBA domain-containing protein n=1 Tax=Nyssa sinensis TaxID=561372 RepID=A0A5J5C5G3_9ASTE|nr:hypothetical protein F0562_002299 [Nyssa sinensis]